MKYFYLLVLTAIVSQFTLAQTSIQDGNWNNPTSWDCACVPNAFSSSLNIVVNHSITADFAGGSTYFTGGTLTIGASGSLIQTGPGDLYMDNATTTVNGTLDMRRIAIEGGSAVYNGTIQNCDSLWNDNSDVVNNGVITTFDHQVYEAGSMTNNGTITITNDMNIMGEYVNSTSGEIMIERDFSNANLLGGRALYTNNGSHIIFRNFLNAANDTIKGTGYICIGNASTNQGKVLGTLTIETPSGSFTLNPGFVGPSVNFTAGNCGLSLIESNTFEWLVYPNPFVDIVTIIGENGLVSAEIIDINGKVVFNDETGSQSINLEHLDQGNYFLKLLDTPGNLQIVRLVK